MRIPVTPFLASLALLLASAYVLLMKPHTWWLFSLALINFSYSSHREIWHNGKPLTLHRRRK